MTPFLRCPVLVQPIQFCWQNLVFVVSWKGFSKSLQIPRCFYWIRLYIAGPDVLFTLLKLQPQTFFGNGGKVGVFRSL